MNKSSLLIAFFILILNGCETLTSPTPADPSPAPSASAALNTNPATPSNTQNWTEAQILAYTDCLDSQFPKDETARMVRLNLKSAQNQKDALPVAAYQAQLNQIGSVLVNTESNRGTALMPDSQPSGCESKIGR